ncbi:MAG: hypothetical protein AB1760_00275 [Pseudomonadota bacterium]
MAEHVSLPEPSDTAYLFDILTQTSEELLAAKSLLETVARKLGLPEANEGSSSVPWLNTISTLAADNLHAAISVKAWAASVDRFLGGVPVVEKAS